MSDAASIYDLLSDEEEPTARPARRRGGTRWWAGLLLAAAALTAVTLVGLRVIGIAVSVLAVLCGWSALLVLRRFTAVVAPAPPPRGSRPGEPLDDESQPADRDALRVAVGRWERLLDWSAGDGDRFRRRIAPRIGEIVDERLRQRYGLTRQSDPARARAILGDQVWNLLTAPPRRGPSPRDCAAIVAQLEKI
ncbi:MAG TPA: hypothetical protein VGD43_21445 [Micromonospora sp.]